MRFPAFHFPQHPLEDHFYYHWNSARRRAHIVIILLSALLALAVYTANPLNRLFAAPVSPKAAANLATLRMLQDNPYVLAIAPNGNDLYVSGTFTTIGGLSARGIARYNMQTGQWSTLGNNNVLEGNGVNGLVAAMAIVGNDLYVGGSFTRCFNNNTESGKVSANCIAKFNTQTKLWSALGGSSGNTGNGFDGDVATIAVLNGSVYMGGTFKNAHINTGNNLLVNGVARWNTQTNTWAALGKGTSTDTSSGVVNDLAVIGNDLYAGGTFTGVTNSNDTKVGVGYIARWNTQTSTWAALGTGTGSANNGVDSFVYALATNGTELYVGGAFNHATNNSSSKLLTNYLARWTGSAWGLVGSAGTATGNGVENIVWELAYSGGNLYVGGEFTSAFNNGTTSANGIARWNGTSWAALGTSTGNNGNGVDETVNAITPIGNMLYVGGNFSEAFNSSSNSVDANSIARWNGTSWSTLGATTVKTLAAVSAASFSGTELSEESIVAAFGTGLATSTASATTTPLPTSLAGTTVSVKDSAGTTRQAPLFFVSGGQVNFLIPDGTAPGTATITITSGDGSVSAGDETITVVAPGMFAMNANGQGVVAAVALRVRGTTQTFESIARFDTGTNKWVATPIDLGPETDQVFLICFGTGFRNRTSLTNVVAKIGGTNVTTSFAGPQGGLVGLDQGNLQIARSLIGRGEVDLVLTVDGKTANTVRVNIK